LTLEIIFVGMLDQHARFDSGVKRTRLRLCQKNFLKLGKRIMFCRGWHYRIDHIHVQRYTMEQSAAIRDTNVILSSSTLSFAQKL